MDERIKNLLTTLVILQRTDTARDHLNNALAEVDQRVNQLNDKLTTFEGEVQQGQEQLDALKKQYRDDESEIKEMDRSIEKSEEKLRSVKTNKEYQSMLKEIDDMKHRKSAIEDRMLEALESMEAAEKNVASLKADLADMKNEIEGQQEEIRESAQIQQKEMTSLNAEREEIWTELDARTQKLYNRAFQHGHGVAVAGIDNAVCQECRMNIPPQAYIELMRLDEMSMCPHCQRIIYPKAVIEGEPSED